jgi:hypothetical protein
VNDIPRIFEVHARGLCVHGPQKCEEYRPQFITEGISLTCYDYVCMACSHRPVQMVNQLIN